MAVSDLAGTSSTFCLRHAAHALTFLDIPGNLFCSTGTPLLELARGGRGGPLAIGVCSSNELRVFFGEVECAGDVEECGDTDDDRCAAPGMDRGEGRLASCQLRFDMVARETPAKVEVAQRRPGRRAGRRTCRNQWRPLCEGVDEQRK